VFQKTSYQGPFIGWHRNPYFNNWHDEVSSDYDLLLGFQNFAIGHQLCALQRQITLTTYFGFVADQ
jgi:hypothetical protein